ncbi:MAG: hypothetical protein ABIP74_02210 [Candidatus Saccharimonas sp.]
MEAFLSGLGAVILLAIFGWIFSRNVMKHMPSTLLEASLSAVIVTILVGIVGSLVGGVIPTTSPGASATQPVSWSAM